MGGGFGPTVALPLLHLHCERERGGGVVVCLCAFYKLDVYVNNTPRKNVVMCM